MVSRCLVVVLLVLLGSFEGLAEEPNRSLERNESTELRALFQEASEEFGVPLAVLVGIAVQETGLTAIPRNAESEGNPLVGVMGLRTHASVGATAAAAAARLGIAPVALRADRRQNIRGAAAWLSHEAGQGVHRLSKWLHVAAKYAGYTSAGGRRYQTTLGTFLLAGARIPLRDGSHFVLPGLDDQGMQDYITVLGDLIPASPDYGSADYAPACSGNYTSSNRTPADISRIVIHTVQGSYSSCINWFANCDAGASAHYVVSKSGEVTQMVLHEDIAWHAGYWDYNTSSIGIEHEGFAEEADNYTDPMMAASAALTQYLAFQNDIPLTRDWIVGHNEVPGCPYSGGGSSCHTDPGQYFDWDTYMDLLTNGEWEPPGESGGDEPVTPTEVVGFIREGDIYTGDNIEGAQVSLSDGNSTLTGADGYFSFLNPAPGAMILMATKPGYVDAEEEIWVVEGEKTWNSMPLELLPEEEETGEGSHEEGGEEAPSGTENAGEEGSTEEGSTEEGSTEEGSTEEGSTEEGSTEEGSTEEGSTEEELLDDKEEETDPNWQVDQGESGESFGGELGSNPGSPIGGLPLEGITSQNSDSLSSQDDGCQSTHGSPLSAVFFFLGLFFFCGWRGSRLAAP